MSVEVASVDLASVDLVSVELASVDLVLAVVIAVLFACGFALLIERSLTRVVMGLVMLGNGANLLIMSGGRPGRPPITGVAAPEQMSDPLPQAMVLTSIVIALGVTAFLLAMAYRSWQLTGHDEVPDDVEDRRIRRKATRDEVPAAYDEPFDETADPSRTALWEGLEIGEIPGREQRPDIERRRPRDEPASGEADPRSRPG